MTFDLIKQLVTAITDQALQPETGKPDHLTKLPCRDATEADLVPLYEKGNQNFRSK